MSGLRRTLARATEPFSGVGLHSGKAATVCVRPAPPGAGLVFCDTRRGQELVVLAANVSDTSRCTILGQGENAWQTVEHVLSALTGLGVDDAIIEAECGEMPAGDGSALPFVKLLQAAGLCDVPGTAIAPITLSAPICVQGADGSCIAALPCGTLRVTVTLDYPKYPYLGTMAAAFDAGTDDYASQIAPARTYGFVSEIAYLRSHGLALGASRENAVALGEAGYETPLRFPNELARHKLLDVLGDLALAGRPVQAHVLAWRPGHTLNVRLASLLAEM